MGVEAALRFIIAAMPYVGDNFTKVLLLQLGNTRERNPEAIECVFLCHLPAQLPSTATPTLNPRIARAAFRTTPARQPRPSSRC